jgi:cytochrome c553
MMPGLALAFLIALAVLPASAVTIEEQLAPCLACHGPKGQSDIPEVPSLGGQPAFYLSVQLFMFRERMRSNEPMNALLKGTSDDDLRRIAEAIAKWPPPVPGAEPSDPARLERARALVEQHRCNFCHNPDFSAQREDYLVKSLREYKNNSRRAYDPSMADVMFPLTDADILDLAYYLARFH